MSSAYRYVVFRPGKQPTTDEVDRLREWATAAKRRFAIGVSADDGGLALAFEADSFASLDAVNAPFAKLLRHWEHRGCEVRERLRFIKQPTALQPTPTVWWHDKPGQGSRSNVREKQLAAAEALGSAGLRLQQSLDQHALLQRVAKWVPYSLMALAGLLTIVAGVYFWQRLSESPQERRQETIQRVASDAMDETLAVQRTKLEPQRHDVQESTQE